MLIKAGIKQLVIAEHVFSMRFVTENNQEVLEELERLKNKQTVFTLIPQRKDEDGKPVKIYFTGKVKSINIRNKINFVIHTEKDKIVIIRTIKIMDEPITIAFKSDREKLLTELLQKAGEVTSKSIPEIIRELTSFTTKDGRFIEGKTNIYALSEKQKEVLTDKLLKLTTTPKEVMAG